MIQSTEKLPSEDTEKDLNIVIKIGGSCLRDGKTVGNIVEKIKKITEQGIIPIIVVSAMRGMTDSLFELITNSHKHHDPRTIDTLVSEGEQLSAKIISSALKSAGIKARAVLPSKGIFPIVTDENYGNARILIEETERNIRDILIPLIDDGIIPVVPGFIGVSKNGSITTIGRGGSDTTAIMIGKILKTKEVILLKDVPGILSGDPKVVDSPSVIPVASMKEIFNLGLRGGKVVSPEALIHKDDTDLRIVYFDSEDILEGGTRITGIKEKDTIIEIKENISLITVIGRDRVNIPEIIMQISRIMSEKNIEYFPLYISDHAVTLYIDTGCLQDVLKQIHEIVVENEHLISVTSLSGIICVRITFYDIFTGMKKIKEAWDLLMKKRVKIIDLSINLPEACIYIQGNKNRIMRIVEENL